jgi:beta-glucanase (GH16 family)
VTHRASRRIRGLQTVAILALVGGLSATSAPPASAVVHLSVFNPRMHTIAATSSTPGAMRRATSATGTGILFSDQFTSFDTNVWWPGYPYHADASLGAMDEGSKSSWNAVPAQSIAGSPIRPFSIIADPTATDGKALRITCRRTTPAQAAALRALGASAAASHWAGGIAISKANFGQGYVEWRMRLPNPGAGMFPALWAFGSVTNHNDFAHDHAEMDMLEVFGKAAGTPWYTTLHLKDKLANGPSYQIASRSDSTTGWHTYGMDWHADTLRFYRDGALIADASKYAYFYRGLKMQLRMNYSVGDALSWMPHTNTSTPNSLTMDIDYVRQYLVKP